MDSTVVSEYRPHLVAASFALALIGSLIALMVTRRIRHKDGSLNRAAAVTAGVALGGIGVWSMHFVGMVALRLDVASSYGIVESAVSLGLPWSAPRPHSSSCPRRLGTWHAFWAQGCCWAWVWRACTTWACTA